MSLGSCRNSPGPRVALELWDGRAAIYIYIDASRCRALTVLILFQFGYKDDLLWSLTRILRADSFLGRLCLNSCLNRAMGAAMVYNGAIRESNSSGSCFAGVGCEV